MGNLRKCRSITMCEELWPTGKEGYAHGPHEATSRGEGRMYQIVTNTLSGQGMNDVVVHSYAHPTVSTVTGDQRQVWQLVEDMETMVAEFPTAEIAATVDCQHAEADCPCMQAVLAQ